MTIGDPDWEYVQTGQRYSNAVSYYNNCKIATLTNREKLALYVKLKAPDIKPAVVDSVRCQALSLAPPQTKVDFETISTSSCEVAADE